MTDFFRCPFCKGVLNYSSSQLECVACSQPFSVIDGMPDLFVDTPEHDWNVDPNQVWLDPEVAYARDTIYRLSARDLQGMAFVMEQMARRSFAGCRILEVGMGTGHFTQWLAERVDTGTEIYAFDYSWPILKLAQRTIAGQGGIVVFRANARGSLPFDSACFDIVSLRLAPLGGRGVPVVQAGLELLKPGGWFVEAGGQKEALETPPLEWAFRHGYERAEYHEWQYSRIESCEEYLANRLEMAVLHQGQSVAKAQAMVDILQRDEDTQRGVLKCVSESVLLAQKHK